MKLHVLMVGITLFVATAAVVQAQAIPQAAPASPGGSAAPANIAQADNAEKAALGVFMQATPAAKFYQQGGRISRVYGTAMEYGATPVEAAEQFRVKNAKMLGVDAVELAPVTRILDGGNTLPLMLDSETGQIKFTLIYYSQYRDGVPVFRSDVRMLVRNEANYPLVWVGSTLRRLGDFTVDQALAAAPQSAAAMDGTGMTNFTQPETVIWAGVEDEVVQPVLAVTFIGDNDGSPDAQAPERWLYVADAATGEILYKENLIIFTDVTGNVSGMATPGYKADLCTSVVATPLKYAKVAIGSSTGYADGNGNYSVSNSGSSPVSVDSNMSGLYFYVSDVAGPEDVLSQVITPPGPANFTHNQANNNEYVRAQINGYVQANVVRDFVVKYSPNYPTISGQTGFQVRVNRTDVYCPGNAWYDGSKINFCSSGAGYPNSAFSSVIHHEYGHHVVQCGGSGQDQYGEGMSDCISICIADDHVMAWGFFGNCSSGLRDAANSYSYPCVGESHDCGNLISGCVWSTRNELAVTNPTLYRDIISGLTVNSVPLHSGDQITPQITIDFLTLDDNDSDIYNGTPHAKEICAGFGAHSMACPDGVLNPITFQFPDGLPTETLSMTQAYFRVNVVAAGADPVAGTGQLHYSIDGSAWTAVAMTQTAANQYQATFPSATCRSQIDWYVSAQASDSLTYTDPILAPVGVYTTAAGKVVSVTTADNFEFSQGWTAGDTGDDATSGIWELGVPQGTTAQPSANHTPLPGKKCWITGAAAGANANANDVDGGKTTLMSPTINLGSVTDPIVSYWRWYSNDKGSAPGIDVFTVGISNDNGSTWTTAETVGPTGTGTTGGWLRHSLRVADFVTPTAQVKLRFVASDSGADSLVEAAIDDFKVSTYQCDTFAPTPNPPAWIQQPTTLSTTSITMQAYATDPSGVEYFFSGSGVGVHSRNWGASDAFTDTALQVNRAYSYKVKARDGAVPVPNETAYSTAVNVATFIETPTDLSIGTVTGSSIQLTAPGTFTRLTSNLSGMFFEVTTLGGTPVGGAQANTWLQVQTITATGLTPGATYRFRIKARNYYGVNETPWYPASGYVNQGTTPPPCSLLGDMNADGVVNGLDIDAFVRAKLGGSPLVGENQGCANYGGSLEQDTAAFVADLLGL